MPRPKLKAGEKGFNGRANYRMCVCCRKQYQAEQNYIIHITSKGTDQYVINICEKCKEQGKVQITLEYKNKTKNLLK